MVVPSSVLVRCGVVPHEATRQELMIYTAAGRVGTDVRTGSLVEALELYDITLCEASQESDRRQILNS